MQLSMRGLVHMPHCLCLCPSLASGTATLVTAILLDVEAGGTTGWHLNVNTSCRKLGAAYSMCIKSLDVS